MLCANLRMHSCLTEFYSCAAFDSLGPENKLLELTYLVCEARLRAVAIVSTYTSATDGGMCLISTAQGTSSLNIHTAPAFTPSHDTATV